LIHDIGNYVVTIYETDRHTTGATCGAGTDYPSGAPDFFAGV